MLEDGSSKFARLLIDLLVPLRFAAVHLPLRRLEWYWMLIEAKARSLNAAGTKLKQLRRTNDGRVSPIISLNNPQGFPCAVPLSLN